MKDQTQNKTAAVMATVFLAAAEALAQDQQSPSSEEGEESKRRIIISISDRRLAVVEDGRVVKIYPTAVGADRTPSPTGVYKIVNRVPNPTWYGPNHKIVPPGKANPLGTRWMGLSRRGYGIHGTNAPSSIGQNASHGSRPHSVQPCSLAAEKGSVRRGTGTRNSPIAPSRSTKSGLRMSP